MVSQSSNLVLCARNRRADFGADGIGGNRMSSDGNGLYVLSIDLDNDGTREFRLPFHRLYGDANGDRIVDRSDTLLVAREVRTQSPTADLNGDGRVSVTDLRITGQQRNQRVTGSVNAGDLVAEGEQSGESPWHNILAAGDVDGNGRLEPIDALVIVNELNRRRVSSASGVLSGSSDTTMTFAGSPTLSVRGRVLVVRSAGSSSRWMRRKPKV